MCRCHMFFVPPVTGSAGTANCDICASSSVCQPQGCAAGYAFDSSSSLCTGRWRCLVVNTFIVKHYRGRFITIFAFFE